jgi:hypothetical protein
MAIGQTIDPNRCRSESDFVGCHNVVFGASLGSCTSEDLVEYHQIRRV